MAPTTEIGSCYPAQGKWSRRVPRDFVPLLEVHVRGSPWKRNMAKQVWLEYLNTDVLVEIQFLPISKKTAIAPWRISSIPLRQSS